ncbi:hypothetical protein NL676_006435 [Syzygium grande]|nr:hypothetical protein NL676_006435 [Syzygium grande]
MASIYTCKECGPNLHLSTLHLYPPDFCFEAENEDPLSFSSLDASKFRFEKEDKRSGPSSRHSTTGASSGGGPKSSATTAAASSVTSTMTGFQ